VPAHVEQPAAFAPDALRTLRRALLGSPYFAAHTLNRDFVGTRGFSVVFRADGRREVERAFPALVAYLARVLRTDCNAFYLNPLLLGPGSRVDPHVDRSLRSYCKEILPPVAVSVLYVAISPGLAGGELVLARGRRQLARVRPVAGTLLSFDGDLTHSIEPLTGPGERLSLVCEQYALEEDELARVPPFKVETRARGY
jgi:predicted 2-oxoglutarate/Fe(II)-dependent dioxygenase YbiX